MHACRRSIGHCVTRRSSREPDMFAKDQTEHQEQVICKPSQEAILATYGIYAKDRIGGSLRLEDIFHCRADSGII